MLELSRKEARRIMIGAQLLAGPVPKRPTKQRMLDTIRHLGALQIDSISVVARSHHIVLWSRLGHHPHDWLYELQGRDRALFEYWAHACAYVPIELFPYFRRAMLEYVDAATPGWSARVRDWIRENQTLIDEVIDHVRVNGPVSTSSFDPPEGSAKATAWAWYGNKPTNRALDLLWTDGRLMIDRREKFQRWYDLTERVHPTWDDALLPSVEEERLALGERALRAMGVTTTRWLPDYFRTNWGVRSIPGTGSRQIMDELVERGIATPATIRGIPGEFVVLNDLLEAKIPLSRTTLLSSFDSLVWDRKRTLAMFDFELQLEAYTPAEKRRYGYFSLPILYRDQLVGRLDPKAERKTGQFTVRTLHIEPAFVGKDDERFYAALAGTVRDFAIFNGCNPDTVVIQLSDPSEAQIRLEDALVQAAKVDQLAHTAASSA